MIYRFYQIGYKGASASTVRETIKTLGSWATYMPDQYLLRSHLSAKELQTTLEKIITTGVDVLIIIEFNASEINGWLPTAVWDWVKEEKTKTSVTP